jgi:hypothetical protein
MAPAIPIISLVVGIAGTAYSAYAQKQAGDFQSAMEKRNAEAAERAARDAAARGLNEGVKAALAGGQVRGAIRAGFGASGVEVTSGSPLDVLSDAAMFNELDKQTIANNAEREAHGFRLQAGNYLAQASASRSAGRSNAAGTILSGTASTLGNYYQMR